MIESRPAGPIAARAEGERLEPWCTIAERLGLNPHQIAHMRSEMQDDGEHVEVRFEGVIVVPLTEWRKHLEAAP